jgi:hypothetical protein
MSISRLTQLLQPTSFQMRTLKKVPSLSRITLIGKKIG